MDSVRYVKKATVSIKCTIYNYGNIHRMNKVSVLLWCMLVHGISMMLLFSITLGMIGDSFASDTSRRFAVYELVFAVLSICLVIGAVLVDRINYKNPWCQVMACPSTTDVFQSPTLFLVTSIAYLLYSILCGYHWNERSTMLFGKGAQTCHDDSFYGCPTTQAVKKYGIEIKTASDCLFNAWVNTDQAYTENLEGNVSLIDWSKMRYYDDKMQRFVALALNSNCPDTTCDFRVAPKDMPDIEYCWNWGCHDVCNESRYHINRVWFIASIVNFIACIAFIFLCLWIGVTLTMKTKTSDKNGSNNETAPLINGDQTSVSSVKSDKRRSRSAGRSRKVTLRM